MALTVQGGEFWKVFTPVTAPAKAMHREKPDTCQDPPVEQLANQIDWLEHYIDEYGTIVAKHPDVWGESRLTRHREEYERQMAQQLNGFDVTYQGSLARSDQAYLGFALALSSAASGTTTAPATTDVVNNMNATLGATTTGSGAAQEVSPSGTIQPSTAFSLNAKTKMSELGFNPTTISLEPTMMLTERSRYLNYLHELRRINEGSDTNDSPGYALDLVRVPISVLPGKKTREGHGAEITITATPYLTPELLPATFRGLVTNDLVDLLAPALTQWVNDPEVTLNATELLAAEAKVAQANVEAAERQEKVKKLVDKIAREPLSLSPDERRQFMEHVDEGTITLSEKVRSTPERGPAILGLEEFKAFAAGAQPSGKLARSQKTSRDHAKTTHTNLWRAIQKGHAPTIAHTPGTKTRRAYMPIPPSQIVEVFGEHMVARMIYEAHRSLSRSPVNRQLIQLMDVRGLLSEETHAAYLFLGYDVRPEDGAEAPQALDGARHITLWQTQCNRDLAMAVRERRMRDVFNARGSYLMLVGADHGRADCLCPESLKPDDAPSNVPSIDDLPGLNPRDPNGFPVCKTLTSALGWGLLVESALLNEQLNEDYHEAMISKGCGSGCPVNAWYAFFGPNPPIEARQAFMDYVRCRWPIRIFALDPVVDQQNIEDAYSRRRELQIALAMGFASGQINAQGMLRFSRQLEWDMATVALNQTAIGFSHGDDTFGWRFYPRFQTPPIKGNVQALWETVAGGPTTDQDMRMRQLEPMQRECVAIVVMPSFVPYVTFESRSRFFKITNPECTEISMRQTMLLSRSIKAMQQSAAQCSACACLYRDGEVSRLLNRVHQLDQTLPTQTMQVQLPFENTCGGFELFNRGVTDLAPELVGWYGAPGIDPRGGTTLFLVGKAFGVNGTKVITGGRLADFKLLSRQVMEVQVPPGVEIVSDHDANEFVDVHVATCYGVTDHLLVPLAPTGALLQRAGTAALAFEAKHSISVTIAATNAAGGTYGYTATVQSVDPPYLAFTAPPLSTLSASLPVDVFVTIPNSGYIGTPAPVTFVLDVANGRYLLASSNLNALTTAIGKVVSDYLAATATNKLPLQQILFQLKAQASPTGSTPIPISGSVDINVTVTRPNP
jgi:hypothetical protein